MSNNFEASRKTLAVKHGYDSPYLGHLYHELVSLNRINASRIHKETKPIKAKAPHKTTVNYIY